MNYMHKKFQLSSSNRTGDTARQSLGTFLMSQKVAPNFALIFRPSDLYPAKSISHRALKLGRNLLKC